MYELRIANGLHRGAVLPLDDRPHILGAGDDDDVVLVDPGIEPQHATLSRSGAGWILTADNGALYGANSNRQQNEVSLMPGEFVRLGDVWITIAAPDAPWGNPPPIPTDSSFIDVNELQEDADESLGAAEESAEVLQSDQAEYAEEKAPARRSRRRMFIAPVAMAAVLSAAAAYAVSSKSSMPDSLDKPMKLESLPKKSGTSLGDKPLETAEVKKPEVTEPSMTPAELRDAFRKRLSDAYLLNRFDLTLNDDSWTMRAALDDEETKRFERILTAFIAKHKITFPVHAQVGSAEAMLPFKIRQVISGANSSVVTQDGTRLYIGDEYKGVRLVAVASNHLTFAGKRKIEVNW